jgi:hypothetical protein
LAKKQEPDKHTEGREAVETHIRMASYLTGLRRLSGAHASSAQAVVEPQRSIFSVFSRWQQPWNKTPGHNNPRRVLMSL